MLAGLPCRVCLAASSFKSTATTVAPSSAKRCAIARPMPWPAPVTTATFPAKRILVSLLMCNQNGDSVKAASAHRPTRLSKFAPIAIASIASEAIQDCISLHFHIFVSGLQPSRVRPHLNFTAWQQH
jgi:hypothetical protein